MKEIQNLQEQELSRVSNSRYIAEPLIIELVVFFRFTSVTSLLQIVELLASVLTFKIQVTRPYDNLTSFPFFQLQTNKEKMDKTKQESVLLTRCFNSISIFLFLTDQMFSKFTYQNDV